MAFFKKLNLKASSKHKKFTDMQNALKAEANLTNNEGATENEDEVSNFKLKYLGNTVVEKVKQGENISAEAVKNIIKIAKAQRKQKVKLLRVNVAVSIKGIVVTDLQGTEVVKASIYRISNCASDSTHRQVFSFISTDEHDTMECHAFWCSKRKVADTVTLAVGKAFGQAYQAWRIMPNSHEFLNFKSKENQHNNTINNTLTNGNSREEPSPTNEKEEKLIDFDSDVEPEEDDEFDELCKKRAVSNSSNSWVCFEDDFIPTAPQGMPPQRNNLVFA